VKLPVRGSLDRVFYVPDRLMEHPQMFLAAVNTGATRLSASFYGRASL
jgi:hypothetical protein